MSLIDIKPQPCQMGSVANRSCVISFFYIKPQHLLGGIMNQICCVISFFYIKPQLHVGVFVGGSGCVISFFYIKPQLRQRLRVAAMVALYLSSTSNHNPVTFVVPEEGLRYIFLLHQTTTPSQIVLTGPKVALYLSSTSNHNLKRSLPAHRFCCVISFFYIKPQPI